MFYEACAANQFYWKMKFLKKADYIGYANVRLSKWQTKQQKYLELSHILQLYQPFRLLTKCVRIRSYSSPHFPAFGLNTERYGVYGVWRDEVSVLIQSKCGKMRTRITPNMDTLYAVNELI